MDFLQFQEKENIIPLKLKNKEKFITDLGNIKDSFTGRFTSFANAFILESAQLIINSLVLFEMGYFDNAYYSLRQSLEVSTTLVFLMELEPLKREEELNKWKSKSKFPMFNEMVKFLDKNKEVFYDMKLKLSNYFNELQKVKEWLNKFVHKQGFDTFYVSRNHPFSSRDYNRDIIEFEDIVIKCIGAIAILRLAIDPIPILLMDDEIYSRTRPMMCEPYSPEFVDTYIGNEIISKYKETNFYKGHYEYFIQSEKMNDSVLDLVKYQFIDKENFDLILSQSHLLDTYEYLSAIITCSCEKISRIYYKSTWNIYTTSTKSLSSRFGYHGSFFIELMESETHLNVPIDGVYISYIKLDIEDVFIEHNIVFDDMEWLELVSKWEEGYKSRVKDRD